MDYKNRRYLVIPVEIIDTIDFNQVLETSKDTLRLSVDKTKTFVKYDIVILTENEVYTYFDAETNQEMTHITPAGTYGRPSFFDQGLGEYTYTQILDILSTEEWTKNNRVL
jgi:hypothetical protein